MESITIIMPDYCPRLTYIAKQIFTIQRGLPCRFDIQQGMEADTYILETPTSQKTYSTTVFFHQEFPDTTSFPWDDILTNPMEHDWLGASFLLMSRAEEYHHTSQDPHGRFPYQSSIAYQKGFIHQPVIDEWSFLFLKDHLPPDNVPLQILPTLDIDMTHAILGRPLWRRMGALIKATLRGSFFRHVQVLARQAPDPYDNADLQCKLLKEHRRQAVYFFQSGTYGQYDKNISPHHPLFKKTVDQIIAAGHTIGLHPSYAQFDNPGMLEIEKLALEHLTGNEIAHSRFHFLRFRLPESYRYLLQHHILHDYSMGYSDVVGYRASTSLPFSWYDLTQEKSTPLTLYPFSVMDVALQYYQQMSPEKAMEVIHDMKHTLQQVRGCFSFCYHNESLSEIRGWKGWTTVFEYALKPL
jgi:hypothetical protein